MNTIEDFENAPAGATATLGEGNRVMKIDNGLRVWITQDGYFLSDEDVWGWGFTLDPLPEPLDEKETEE